MKQKLNYGLDGPRVIYGFFLLAAVALVGFLILIFADVGVGFVEVGAFFFLLCFLISLFTSVLMIYSSKVGKIRFAKKLVAGLPLKGDERVLDVGCGRGLYVIEIAQRLGEGKVTGVDIWQKKDLSGNVRDHLEDNIDLAGVRHQVEIVPTDMRAMPFESSTFDVVVSSLAIHNLVSKGDRFDALREITRVAKPGSRFILVDFQFHKEYAAALKKLGWSHVEVSKPHFITYPPHRMVLATK